MRQANVDGGQFMYTLYVTVDHDVWGVGTLKKCWKPEKKCWKPEKQTL